MYDQTQSCGAAAHRVVALQVHDRLLLEQVQLKGVVQRQVGAQLCKRGLHARRATCTRRGGQNRIYSCMTTVYTPYIQSFPTGKTGLLGLAKCRSGQPCMYAVWGARFM